MSKSEVNSANLITLLNYIVKDSFILPLSLYYTPNVITISCIKTLRERYNLEFINIKELTSLSDYNIDEEDIDQCASFIRKLEAAIDERKIQNNKSKNSNNNVINCEKEKEIDGVKGAQDSSGPSITKVIPTIKMNIE